MLSLGLDTPGQRAFEATLGGTYHLRTQVRLLDLDGHEQADLSARLLDGQVNLDASADTTRQATVTVDDPTHTLDLDANAPGDGAMFADRMLAITYGVFVEGLGRNGQWVDVPVFTGPISGLSRNGDSVELACLGKEVLAKGMTWRSLEFKKGHNVLDAIKSILQDRAGEKSFDFPSSGSLTKKRLGHKGLALARMSVPWDAAQTLAGSINAQLYYDGAGRCVLRDSATQNAWTFKDGDGGTVLTRPDIAFDLESLVNAVYVKGGKPKGSKHAATAVAVAPHDHPLSPYRLGRGGVPRYLATEVDNDNLKSKKDAQAAADRTLHQGLAEGVSVSFDALPVPHLDVLDDVSVRVDGLAVPFSFRTASIPLVHSGSMSVGSVKRVTPNSKSIRGRRG